MDSSDSRVQGYRAEPGAGPRVRTDIVDVYVFCRVPASTGRLHVPPQLEFEAARGSKGDVGKRASSGGMGAESFGAEIDRLFFLQLLRTREPLAKTWHPIMGHIDTDANGQTETAAACATRELNEEVGLDPFAGACLGFWALEQVHPFFIASIDCIVMSPRFAAEVAPSWSPALNTEHSSHRWVDGRSALRAFMWPGQHRAIEEIRTTLAPHESLCRESLRVLPASSHPRA